MHGKSLLLVLGLLLTGAACTKQTTTNSVSNTNVADVQTTNASDTNTVAPASRDEVDPISIPALMTYTLTGRDLNIGRILETHATYTRHYLTYASDDLTISGIINIPKGDGPFPVLFLNHGYIDPSVYTNGRGLRREQDYLARQGFIVLHSDYRCHAQSTCPTSDPLAQRLMYAKDVMNAVQAVSVLGDPRFDTTKFGMLGHSMGGGVTQTIMVAKPDLIQAAVLYAPVSSDYRDSYERYTRRRPADVRAIEARYGTPADNPVFWSALSPRSYFDRVKIPLLYFQGTKDESVPKAWNDQTVELLKAAGRDVTYVVYDGQPHEFTSSWSDFMQQSTTFFTARLSG